ncbi:hypothetical protein ACFL2A_05340 [Thermodesulfobacteriota bacterium]
MIKHSKLFIIFLISLNLLLGCRGSEKETKIKGMVHYNGTGLSSATIEIYLKSGRDKSIPPFVSAESDASGSFTIALPPGKYFIIGKKRFMEGGITKMLVGDYPKNPVIVEKNQTVEVSAFSLFNMGEDKRLDIEGSGFIGKATSDEASLEGTFVYVYPESNSSMLGPSYVVANEIEKDGTLKVNLLPGKYNVALRKRGNSSKLGYLNVGDFAVHHPDNPLEVKQDEYFDLGMLKLHEVDKARLDKIKKDEAKFVYGTKVTGQVLNEDDEPAQGLYVYAYKDPKMVGKPHALSKKTDSNGKYTLYVTKSENSNNKYYIGARTNFGGPLEPGEYVGTYNADQEHAIIVDDEKEISDINIMVKEVW